MSEASAQAHPGSWFREHYVEAVGQVLDFLGGDGISLEGRRVADLGCGDGILDLGLVRAANPAELVGYDLRPTDVAHLSAIARQEGEDGELPRNLHFRQSSPDAIPADSGSIDVLLSWSAFEHIADLHPICREIRRVLSPVGVAFIQVWPLYHSEHGSHLWDWLGGFEHLLHGAADIEAIVRRGGGDRAWAEIMLEEYRSLNRVRLDDIADALQQAAMSVTKFELMGSCFHIPEGLFGAVPLSDLAIGGFKLLAVPA